MMSEHLKLLLKGYENKYPQQLVGKYPRIAEKIVALWDTPEAFEVYLQDLLVADRHDRQGFPPDVASELLSINMIYDEIQRLQKQPEDIWGSEADKAKEELDRIGVAVTQLSLFQASERRNPETLKLLLKAGMNPNVRDEKEWTPLMVASFEGSEDIALILIQHGASVMAKDRGGYTPLHWAALGGFTSVVKLLIQKSADVSARTNYGITPLIQATAKGHFEVSKVLLEAGAKPNEPSDEGWTALHKAVANGYADIVRVLLEHGGDLLLPNKEGITAFLLAQKSPHEAIRNAIKKWAIEKSAQREAPI